MELETEDKSAVLPFETQKAAMFVFFVTPFLKENYRPVTVLLAADKVFEQIVAKQLVGMFDHRLGQALSAYRKTHSCETTPINLIENW